MFALAELNLAALVHDWLGVAQGAYAVDISGIEGRLPDSLVRFYAGLGKMATYDSDWGTTRPRFMQDRLRPVEQLLEQLEAGQPQITFLIENQGVWTVYCDPDPASENVYVLDEPAHTEADASAEKRQLNTTLSQFLLGLTLMELIWATDEEAIADELPVDFRALIAPTAYVWTPEILDDCEHPGLCELGVFDGDKLGGRWAGMMIAAAIPAQALPHFS